MTNATNKLALAKDLVAKMAAAGVAVSLRDAWKLSGLVIVAADRVRDEQARKAREDRVYTAGIARWCTEMRAVGAWDGE